MASFRGLIAVDGPQSNLPPPKGVTFRRRNAKAFTEPPDYPGVFYIPKEPLHYDMQWLLLLLPLMINWKY